MANNRMANIINQTLAVIKLITYSIIAIAGLYHLIAKETSRNNWKRLDGNPALEPYSSAILLVSTPIFF